jgi:iron complex transport system permease protein
MAMFVGAALSIAGASYQGLFQNPMVSQDILGASSGAAFGAALAMILALNVGGITVLSFTFGVVAVLVSYLISKVSRVGTILALILAGMVVSSLFTSGTSFIKLVADTERVLPAITYWLMGSFNTIGLKDLWAVLVIIFASVPIIALRWRINLLATGEEEARSMGINTQAMRIGIIGCATLLTATCISVSGMIGWVGLIIPHFCRLIFGYDYRRIIPAAILMGASFLIVVDDVARLATTSEIPIGILTAVIGAPIFIFLIMRGGVSGGRRS